MPPSSPIPIETKISQNGQKNTFRTPNILISILTFLFLISQVNSLPNSNQENTILLKLKQHWSTSPNVTKWTSSSDHCSWPGIICTQNSVTRIQLAYGNITKPIPQFICDLKNLTSLDLNQNSIPGHFPNIYNCSNLEFLDLSYNYMDGTLPEDINRLSVNLQYLNLTANNFNGDIPKGIGGLSQLKVLELTANHFDGSFPEEIGNLLNLESLVLSFNKFAPQPIPSRFTQLKKLRKFWMTEANLVGNIPENIGNMTSLEFLDLSTNGLSGKIPDGLFQLKNLSIVYLYTNRLSGIIPQAVNSLNLDVVDLCNNSLTGNIPEDFGKLTKLTGLSLFSNQLSEEIPLSIGKLPSLVTVKLFGNRLSGEIPPDFGLFSKLEDFQVSQNQLVGKLPEGICNNKALSKMMAFGNKLTGELPASLGNCSTLKSIRVENNRISGEIPNGLWTAEKLSTLLIHDNFFTGQLPHRVASNLSLVDISKNKFSGELPTGMSTWYSLSVFRASNNLLSGQIPQELTVLPELTILFLDGNHFSGKFPSNISSWKSLVTLNCRKNQLSGQIPSSLGLLPNLIDLDLSSNQFSGEIPSELGNLRPTSFNLSSNRLSGKIPSQLETGFATSFLNNPGLCGSNCKGETRSDKLTVKLVAALASLAGVTFLVAVLYSLFVLRRHRKRKQELVPTWKQTSFHKLDFTESDILPNLTENNIIGTGGSGQVYLVPLSRSGNYVAVKSIWRNERLDHKHEKEYLAEVQILGTIRHSNIVKLLCCIFSEESKLLVYEYMENRSLDIWLHSKKRLNSASGSAPYLVLEWPKRLQIAIAAAQGLCYMHHDCSPPIIHRDVKSSNVLLDTQFNAKIADFGLARMLLKPGDNTVTAVAGSFGYIAPEYARKTRVTEKVDVYSFGVVLLELVTGKEANLGDEDSCLADWAWRQIQKGHPIADLLDEDIKETRYFDEICTVLKLGIFCTSTLPSSRPTMKEVLQILIQCNNSSPTSGEKKSETEHDVLPLLMNSRSERIEENDGNGFISLI
ncbi:receptor-like protein kinase 5 [Lycium barbarum]|uniref:receptor-like protein kinase 5 n=1 Tax=Lycium barbarum TaxID=112863 RepID=UPI00293E73A6|nr:receptor-like protein kinase 5 [Lycium barbarum]